MEDLVSNVIMVKSVDWSTFTSGFNIPVDTQPVLYDMIGRSLDRGEKIAIKILLDGKIFDAKLSNSGFDEAKFGDHKTDIVRVMYGGSSQLAKKFQQVFSDLFCELAEQKKTLPPKKQIKIPQDLQRHFTFSITSTKGCFEIEPLEEIAPISTIVSEETYESPDISWIDKSASLVEKQRIVKIRKIDRRICENLKKFYDYHCQVTGEKVGEAFGCEVVEAHHIDYFVNSRNNDSSNIIIISPNFHRIIHRSKPIFNHKKLQFEFANGVVEPLRLNHHLKKR